MAAFEIPFSDGQTTARDPSGPPIANGDFVSLGDPKAYLYLENLQGLHCDRLKGKRRVFVQLTRRRVCFGWFCFWLPWIRTLSMRVDYLDLELSIVDILTYQQPPVSENPGAPSDQKQVYDGLMRLTWQSTEFPFFFIVGTHERVKGQGGSVDIQARLTTSYHVEQDAQGNPIFTHPDTGVADGIKGEMSGDMQPPVLPDAHPHVTATFDSERPLAPPNSYTITYVVKNPVMHGNWL